MTKPARALRVISILSLSLLFTFQARALTLDELRADRELNPQRFLSYFADFKFELRGKTQKPETFLASRSGDCDDFSSLAADLLKERGYTTRLITVSMDAGTHVVCYVDQAKSYLDYNNRASKQLVATTGSLIDIAEKVALSFKSQWHTVSEFTLNDGVPKYICMEFR